MEPVVILGGGLAGLSAAYFLKARPWLLVERTERVGGLIKTDALGVLVERDPRCWPAAPAPGA